MFTADLAVQSLHAELEAVQEASLTMNDRFIAEAALISRELLLDLMRKHECLLEEVTAAQIITELKQRAPITYALPAIPETTSCA